MQTAWRLRVRGLVQGVGFRPCVHRLAMSLNLRGWVANDGDGVLIHLEGDPASLDAFQKRLASSMPAAARIESIAAEETDREGAADFRIRFASLSSTPGLQARIPADRAICERCRADIGDPANRRFGHAFATCTDCGPRYSILDRLPYERHHTAMRGFAMCSACRAEYDDPGERRFHAEPIACPSCGPRLSFSNGQSPSASEEYALNLAGARALTSPIALAAAVESLRAGKIMGLKGLGGYQLLVRADDNEAVMRLRKRKHRPSKPFAVMVRSVEHAEQIACLSPAERDLLLSAENPIVLLPSRGSSALCRAIAPHLTHVGLLLPTTPLHLLLLSALDFPVVATSGNRGAEPIVIDEKERESLESIADAFLEHDRPILRRVDDSVLRIIDEQPMMLRLARGYAPCILAGLEQWPHATWRQDSNLADVSRSQRQDWNLAATLHAAKPVPPMLAVGGQQKTAVAIWTGQQAILSPHIGDMDHPDTRRVFADTVDDLARLYGCEPTVVIADLHPDYFTTQWAQTSGKTCWQVQHHHAHAAACMAEHGLLDREVLAVIWDGTGLGADGMLWGGEILHASAHAFQRVASLDLFALPGGEAAIHEPNRIALSLLAATFGPDAVPGWLIDRLGFSARQVRALTQMIERGVNAPRTSSVGRLFDAVAALLLRVREVTYEGEAALWLEAVVAADEDVAYPIVIRPDADGLPRGDWRPLVRALVHDLANGAAVGVAAVRFHRGLAQWAANIASVSNLADVVLGGGCFQNGWLTQQVRAALLAQGKNVYTPSRFPANDGGLAVGQLAVGMARWRRQATERR